MKTDTNITLVRLGNNILSQEVSQSVLTMERALLVAYQREAWSEYCDVAVANLVKPTKK